MKNLFIQIFILLFGFVLLGSTHSIFGQSPADSGFHASPILLDSLQTDSSKVPPLSDSLPAKEPFSLSPKRIGLYSAIVPGLGQIFNHQYWKLPLIYGGLVIAVYFIHTNSKNYNDFRATYIGRLNNDPAAMNRHPELTSLNQLNDAMNFYRSNLDLTVALTAVGYALQVIDALVFANLKGFDVSQDISMKMQPVSYPTGGIGFGLVVNF